MTRSFKIGDYVKVVTPGHLFSTAIETAIRLGSTKYIAGYNTRERILQAHGRIINIDTNLGICLVDIGDLEILIADRGLELLNRDPSWEIKL